MLLGMSRGHFWAFCLGRRRGCGKTGMGHEGKLLVGRATRGRTYEWLRRSEDRCGDVAQVVPGTCPHADMHRWKRRGVELGDKPKGPVPPGVHR